MRQALRTLCLLAAAALTCPAAHAQKPKSARETKNAKARERQTVRAALLEAAEAARTVEHPVDRVMLQADAADALWPLDAPAARSLLRAAWEFTADPGALSTFQPREEGGRFGARELILTARRHLVTRAAKHDARLAEGFMQEFTRGLPADDEEEPTGTGRWGRGAGRESGEMNTRRLWAAESLLEEGAYESAAAVAAPAAAGGPALPLLRFIQRLRATAPREADALFLRLVEATRADASAGPNDVLLLSTHVVSPEVFALVEPDGSTYLAPAGGRHAGSAEPAPVPSQVRRAFFDAAAAVLLRQPPPVGAEAATRALAHYFAVGRLLPFFEREAPQHVAPLRARLAGLAQELDESRRAAVSAQMNVERLTPRNAPDPLRTQLDALGRAATDADRDRARFEAASAAALKKLWPRAREFAGGIGDPQTRRAAFLLIAAEQVRNAGEGFRDADSTDDFERAAAFVRAADVPAGMRAHGLAQAAELAALKGKKGRAAELFGEAVSLAAQVDRSTDERVALFALLTLSAARLGDARAWELLAGLCAAVNEREARPESEDAPADDCAGVSVETAENSYCVELAERLPEPAEVFASLARLDLERALTEARSLKGGDARARALIHAARGVQGRGAAR